MDRRKILSQIRPVLLDPFKPIESVAPRGPTRLIFGVVKRDVIKADTGEHGRASE